MTTWTYGWGCPGCGLWVTNNVSHVCPGRPYMPPTTSGTYASYIDNVALNRIALALERIAAALEQENQ